MRLGRDTDPLGAARRALDEIVATGPKIRRGGRIQLSPPPLSEATWFQRELGELDARVLSARALALMTLQDARQVVDRGEHVELELLDRMQTAASFAAKVAVDVVTRVFRFSGASVILESSLLSRLLRDLNTVCAHGVLSESGFETHAEYMLGLQTVENRRMI